jgi:putative transposase
MTYHDPTRHHRRSIRLPGYDYAQAGAYFVTINTHNRECLFGAVVNGEMVLSRFGQVAAEYWGAIPHHFPHVELDAWVVMPNHIHGIVWIVANAGSRPRRGEAFSTAWQGAGSGRPADVALVGVRAVENASPLQDASMPAGLVGANAAPPLDLEDADWPRGASARSLGAITGHFKSLTSRRINRMRHAPGARVWQRNYYEHVVRDDRDLERIRAYIAANPLHWAEDEENPDARRPRGKSSPPW